MHHNSLIVAVIAILRIRFAGAYIATIHEKATSKSTIAIAVKGIFHEPPKSKLFQHVYSHYGIIELAPSTITLCPEK